MYGDFKTARVLYHYTGVSEFLEHMWDKWTHQSFTFVEHTLIHALFYLQGQLNAVSQTYISGFL